MADVSIMSMIAGFLPAASDPPPPDDPTVTSARQGRAAAAGSPCAAGHVRSSPTSRRVVHMICFSKDRAFQLDQLLESSKRHLRLVQDKGDGCEGGRQEPAQLRISVLYVAGAAPSPDNEPETASKGGVGVVAEEATGPAGPEAAPSSSASGRCTMEESYDIVRRRHPDVRFVRERAGGFCGQLRSLVREEAGEPTPPGTGGEHEGREERFVLFAVDDMFFYRDFELPGALELLSADPSTFCVHLRLHPGITWSHTSGAPCQVPPLSPSGREVTLPQASFTERPDSSSSSSSGSSSSEDAMASRDPGQEKVGVEPTDGEARKRLAGLAADFGLLTFTREEGTGEWDYPWDLTGGLYRREDVVAVVDGIVSKFGKQAAANPNLLEYHGHALLQCAEDLRSASTEAAGRGGQASGGGTSCGGQPPPGGSPSSSSESTAAADLPTAGEVTSAATSSAPSGAGAAPAAGAAFPAAANPARAAPRCGCSGRAVVSSIAVNRVQSTYSTPVYAAPGGGTEDLDRRLRRHRRPLSPGDVASGRGGAACGRGRDSAASGEEGWAKNAQSVDAGDDLAGEGGEMGRGAGGLDGQCYRRRVFNSVHVGELWFERDGAAEVDRGTVATGTSNSDTLTVLLPVRNGGDKLRDAVNSVVSCAREMPPGWGVELLVVDDGSEDGAVERAAAVVSRANTGVVVVGCGMDLDEDRGRSGVRGGPVKERSTEAGERSCPTWSESGRGETGVTIRILRHEWSLGLAESLNAGLREARGDLVARMDADDVCMPGRLKKQVAYMQEHPRVAVLGTSVATFSGTTIRDSGNTTRIEEHLPLQPPPHAVVHLPVSGVQRISRHPTDQAFLAWSMLFSCCLAHPSVMLRRDRVLAVDGYDPTAEPAEDYDLWLRMESLAPGCIANLGEVLLGLRKHDENVSRHRRVEQGVAAAAAAARAMTRLLTGQGPPRVVTPAQATAIRRPETAVSPRDLAEAARLLGDLGVAAMATAAGESGRATGTDTPAFATNVADLRSGVENSCNNVGDPYQDEGGDGEGEQHRRGRDMVSRDIEARIGAMGVQAMSRFGAGAAPVLNEWNKCFPDRPLLFSLGGAR
eukprot:g2409.t1